MQPLFITGIGTSVGKTLAAAVITEALHADYWKPIQAGLDEGTDALTIQQLLSNTDSVIHPELYRLNIPASPHIAAKIDGITINGNEIAATAKLIIQKTGNKQLIIEGAGGLLVPLNDTFLVADLIKLLGAKLVLVSRNYLGSINHSLLTATYCRNNGLDVAGWIFTDDYMHYESEIVNWSGYPSLGSIPKLETISKQTILQQANLLKPSLQNLFN